MTLRKRFNFSGLLPQACIQRAPSFYILLAPCVNFPQSHMQHSAVFLFLCVKFHFQNQSIVL